MEDQARKKGGENRSKALTPERRKEIASAAAKARHDKRRAAQAPAAEPEPAPEPMPQAAPEPAPEPTRARVQQPPVPKVFQKALDTAQKELAKSLEEINYHEEVLAMKKARLPFLVQTIKALGGTINPEQVQGPSGSFYASNQGGAQTVAVPMPMPGETGMPNLPPVPRAQGGALGVIEEPQARRDDEDQFLRDGMGGKWM